MAARPGRITEDIINAEYQAVYHYILSLARDEKEAEDLTQETFIKAISTDSFRDESSYYSWLCAIGRRLWADKCRRRGIITVPLEADAGKTSDDARSAPAEPRDEAPGVEEILAEGELSRQVHRIIHEMDEPYKEVFTLRIFGDLAFNDISSLFGKSESWARVTYHRARKMIIERLWKENWL